MILTRNQLFIILFFILVCPFTIYKLAWLFNSVKTTGTMEFTGHGNLGSVLGISTYPVIMFLAGGDTVHFNGNLNIPLKRDETVEIRYQKDNPADAKINSFVSIWGDTLVYTLGPLLVFLGLFLTPDLVPKNSKLRVGSKPFLRIINQDEIKTSFH